MARLKNNAPPGSLFKAPPPARDKKYLAAIRQLPCLFPGCGVAPCGTSAHVRQSTYTLARKPSDYRTLPLCHRHHMEQHTEGEQAWWDRHGIDPIAVADRLKAAYPDIEQMTAIVMRSK